MRFRVCPYCGGALDAGEICDCRTEQPASLTKPVAASPFELGAAQCGEFVPSDVLQNLAVQYGTVGRSPASVQLMAPHGFARNYDGTILATFPTFLRQGPHWTFLGYCHKGSVCTHGNRPMSMVECKLGV